MNTPDQGFNYLTRVVLHFADRLYLVFSYPLFFDEFRKDIPLMMNPGLSIRGLHVLPIIHSACRVATLIAIRDIDDVLAPPTEQCRPDDLKAHALGFPDTSRFLTKSERNEINKLVTHSTTRAVDAEGNPGLDTEELLMKAMSQSMSFFEWIKVHQPIEANPQAWAAADFSIRHTELIIRHLQKAKKRPSTGVV